MIGVDGPAAEPQPSIGEEIASSVSHGIGLIMALVAGPFLIGHAIHNGKPGGVATASVFVVTVVVLYLSSTLYHAWPHGRSKRFLRTFEHCAIYLLIAGTYTPISVIKIGGTLGWAMLAVVWLLAVTGIVLKIRIRTKHRWLPGVLYLTLAWMILVALRPLSLSMQHAGIMLLLTGGIIYTMGMAFFAAPQVPYFHSVWHLFVLAGTVCHFIAIWAFVI